MTEKPKIIQREYYTRNASIYETLHCSESGDDYHGVALHVLAAMISLGGHKSVLDAGSGTGRVLRFLCERFPGVRLQGVEPVSALRDVAFANGIEQHELVDGDINCLAYDDESFDVACCFGVLHHVEDPRKAVAELIRVSSKMVFISDANCFGQGQLPFRCLKILLRSLGLWNVCTYLRTSGRGYYESEGDGLAYPYSIFQNYRQLKQGCRSVHIFNTSKSLNLNPLIGASHIAMVGLK